MATAGAPRAAHEHWRLVRGNTTYHPARYSAIRAIFAKSHTSQEGWKEGESEC
eukprot:COSAG06_NODE_34435_length_474_cov_1.346667_2_plen_52_part_01